MNPETVLITTTINIPTVLIEWAKRMKSTDWIIVAGDRKSPHEEIRAVLRGIQLGGGPLTMYLTPERQSYWNVSKHIGWNCIQRRNIALLEAMRLRPQFILTIDDDNAPTKTNQIAELIRTFTPSDLISPLASSSGWWNPGWLCSPGVTHRGYPLSRRHDRSFDTSCVDHSRVGVSAMMWTGAPDIDAVERIAVDPIVTHVDELDVILAPTTWAPFNTQATMFRATLAPAMFMWPHVGRYDDIWASFLTRRVMDELGWSARYGHPVVHQERNPHDLVKDLEAELFGMRHNEQVIDILRNAEIPPELAKTVSQMMSYIFTALKQEATFLPRETIDALMAWERDVIEIESGFRE